MLDKAEATELVRRILHQQNQGKQGNPLVILEDRTLERCFGWVFFYNFKKFVDTGDLNEAALGNTPIIVNKYLGKVEYCRVPHIAYVKEYEKKFLENFPAVKPDPTELDEGIDESQSREVKVRVLLYPAYNDGNPVSRFSCKIYLAEPQSVKFGEVPMHHSFFYKPIDFSSLTIEEIKKEKRFPKPILTPGSPTVIYADIPDLVRDPALREKVIQGARFTLWDGKDIGEGEVLGIRE